MVTESEELFRQVVESAPNAIVMIGPNGLIEMVNAQTEQMFGYSRNDLLGKPVEMLVPERYRRNHPGLRAGFFAGPVSRPMGAVRSYFGLSEMRCRDRAPFWRVCGEIYGRRRARLFWLSAGP